MQVLYHDNTDIGIIYKHLYTYRIPLEHRPIQFHSVFVSFILHSCIKLMTNKLQPFPSKIPRKFNVGCGDYLIILVLHGISISHVCLFKIHVTVAWINWTMFQIKLKPNLMQYYIFYKNRWMCYMTLNESLMRYSIRSWMYFSVYLCWGG